jgi:hypothetical protein
MDFHLGCDVSPIILGLNIVTMMDSARWQHNCFIEGITRKGYIKGFHLECEAVFQLSS